MSPNSRAHARAASAAHRLAGAACALGALTLVLLAWTPAARAEPTVVYHLLYDSSDGTLIGPNPFPPFLVVPQGGQIALYIDGDPDLPGGFELNEGAYDPAFTGPGNVFVEAVSDTGLTGDSALLLPNTTVTSSYHVFIMTFTDIGTYSLGVGIDSASPLTPFHVAVMPSGTGTTTFAGFWNPSIFYPANSIVATGGVFSGLDFWIEANASGTMAQPGAGGFDWYHFQGSGPAGPQGPPGPTGETGATGPAGPAGPRAFPTLAVATSYVIDPNGVPNCFLVDASGGSRVITLPSAGSVENGRLYVVKKMDASTKNAVIVNQLGGGSVEGAASVSITAKLRAMQFVADGKGAWWAVSTQ